MIRIVNNKNRLNRLNKQNYETKGDNDADREEHRQL